MELRKHLPSSAIRFAQITNDGSSHLPEVVAAIKDRYRFWVAPSSPEQWDMENGAVFSHGQFADRVITSLKIYGRGVSVQSDLDTEILDDMLNDMASWLTQSYGVEYEDLQPVPKAFTSAMEVKASSDVLQGLQRFDELASSLTAMLGGYGLTTGPVGVSSVMLNSDPALSKPLQPARFIFERRAGASYDESVFYTEAPVSSKEHLHLLTLLESALGSGK